MIGRFEQFTFNRAKRLHKTVLISLLYKLHVCKYHQRCQSEKSVFHVCYVTKHVGLIQSNLLSVLGTLEMYQARITVQQLQDFSDDNAVFLCPRCFRKSCKGMFNNTAQLNRLVYTFKPNLTHEA